MSQLLSRCNERHRVRGLPLNQQHLCSGARLFWAALRVLVLVLFEGFGYTSATSARADRHVPRVLRIRSGRSRHSMLSSY